MSIIHDALKKVETNVDRHIPPSQQPPAASPPPAAKKRDRSPSAIIIVFVILLLALAGAALRPKKPGAKKKTPPARSLQQRGDFELSGVFNSGNEAYAILNNKVVKTGDAVDGATVRSIEDDEVTIEAGGITKRLSTRLK